jgi:hypothetical protein
VNIAAFYQVARTAKISSDAKLACVLLAGRATKYSLSVRASTEDLADEMGVSIPTARKALKEAVEAGCVTVDKSGGRAPMWTLQGGKIFATRGKGSLVQVEKADAQISPLDVLDKSIRGDAARLKAASPVENLPVTCPDCADHSGWIWHHDGVMRCPHG